MKPPKPIASVSLDLDNEWSYLKTHGSQGWESFPTYLDVVVPRVLNFLEKRNLTITFFVVGQDAALEKNREALAAISRAGHEIGNHSFHHEPWLHLYSEAQIESELARAEEHIECATEQKPVGFRGPGFSLSHATVKSLVRRGYLYDASTLPTYLGPLARVYYFMTATLSPQEKRERKALFGRFSEGLRSIKPYRWQIGGSGLIEIPVTTMPVFKLPIHVSYLLYLSLLAPALALAYFRTALVLCRLTNVQPSLLLHPLDFLDSDDVQDLSFFPAMKLPSEKKLEIVNAVIGLLAHDYKLVTLRQHAFEVSQIPDLAFVKPRLLEQRSS